MKRGQKRKPVVEGGSSKLKYKCLSDNVFFSPIPVILVVSAKMVYTRIFSLVTQAAL